MCTHDIPSYYVRQIQAWPKEKKETFKREYTTWDEERRKREAAVLTEARNISRQEESILLARYGLEVKRKIQDIPEEQKEKGEQKALMPQVPKSESVHMTFLEPNLNGKSHSTKRLPQNGKPGALSEGILQREEKTGSSSSSVLLGKKQTTTNDNTAEVSELLQVLRKYGPCDQEAAQEILSLCRKEAPLCTVRTVVEAVIVKADQMHGRIKQPIGFFRTAVPKLFATPGYADQTEAEIADRLKWDDRQKRMFAAEIMRSPEVTPQEREWAEGILKEG